MPSPAPLPRSSLPRRDGHNDDYEDVGGEAEEDNGEFGIVVPGDGDGTDEYDDRDNEAEDGGDNRKLAAPPSSGGGIRIGRHNDNDSNDDSNNSDCNDDDSNSDCDNERGFLGRDDGRFLCSICLEALSDEPIVTRCGHLYCWLCLYTWLEPSINDRKYSAAFGGGSSGCDSHGDHDDDDYDEGDGGSGPGGRGG